MKKIPLALFAIVIVLLSACASQTKQLTLDNKDSAQRLVNMHHLVALHVSEKQYGQAESLALQALKLSVEVFGEKHPKTLTSMGNLAELYSQLGRYDQAELLLAETLRLRKEVLGEMHPDTLVSMANLAELHQSEKSATLIKPIKTVISKEDASFGETFCDAIKNKQKNNADSLQERKRSLKELELLTTDSTFFQSIPIAPPMGAVESLSIGESASASALVGGLVTGAGIMALLSEPCDEFTDETLILYRELNNTYKKHLPSITQVSLSDDLEQQNNKAIRSVIGYIDTISRIPKQCFPAEAFETAQLAQNPVDAKAMTYMALAYAADNPATKSYVEQLRTAIAERDELYQRFSNQEEAAYAGIKSAIKSKIEAIDRLDATLKNTFPAYQQIIKPYPVALTEIEKTLANDEALLVYLLAENTSYVFVVKHDNAVLRRLSVDKNTLQKDVNTLRQAFYRIGGQDGKTLAPPAPGEMPGAFNIELAHQLYQQLLAPIEAELTGTKHLLTVADGALHSLPLQILVKTAPERIEMGRYSLAQQYKQVDWLVKHFSFSALPSVKSLAVLRGAVKTEVATTQPFIGFGDPIFHGDTGVSKGWTIESLFRAGGNVQSHLIDLPSLPNTATELKNLAKSVDLSLDVPELVRAVIEKSGLAKQRIYLQAQASEAEVKQLSASGQLNTRVLAFSTHGLLAHEAQHHTQLDGTPLPAEAGLVLPDETNSAQDGLLTASEISRLNVTADWVVLSACNTATPEKNSEASGLSELAKAFFLKGSRSVLASHWYVNSATTEHVLTQTFARLKQDSHLSRAEALRQSMLSLINATEGKFSNGRYAHPLYWAPFVIMGEGGV